MLWQDLRYATRLLAKSPIFTAATLGTLALGIGANIAIFSVLEPLLLDRLPVRHPEEIVLVHSAGTLGTVEISELPAYQIYRSHGKALSGVLAFAPMGEIQIVRNGRISSPQGETVTSNYFTVLGVSFIIGRPFDPNDVQGSSDLSPVVLSFDYWKREFGSDPSVIGQELPLSGTSRTIIGVTRPEFFGVVVGRSPDFYVPLEQVAPQPEWVSIVGRLKPNISPIQAQASLEPLFREYSERSPVPAIERHQHMAHVALTPISRGISTLRAEFEKPAQILALVVAMVLLIANLNVANLLLVRGMNRRKEFAVRWALGATRSRLVWQLIIETAAIVILGLTAGMLAGKWTGQLLRASLSTERFSFLIPSPSNYGLIFFSATLFAASLLLSGVLPSISVSGITGDASFQRAYGHFFHHRRVSKFLVVTQIVFAVAILINTGLLLRSLINLETFDVGFDRDKVLAVFLNGNGIGRSPEQVKHFFGELLYRLKRLPGVHSASLSGLTPMSGREFGINVVLEGDLRSQKEETHVFFNSVAPEYFSTLGISLFSGRDFGSQDQKGSEPVAIINRTLARHFFNGKDPVGQHIRFVEGSRPPMRVIGVVNDSVYNSLREQTPGFIYLRLGQFGEPTSVSGVISIRVEGNKSELLSGPVRSVIHSLDSSVTVASIKTLRQQIDETLYQDRLIFRLCGVFSVLALVVTSVGLYGTMSWFVTERNSDIAVRIALGAPRDSIIKLVLRDVMLLIALGLAIGIPAALVASRLISNILFGLRANDLQTILASVVILSCVSLLAGYIPARRASGIDPVSALHSE